MWQEARAGLGYVARARTCGTSPPAPGTLNLFGNIGGVLLLLYIVGDERGSSR